MTPYPLCASNNTHDDETSKQASLWKKPNETPISREDAAAAAASLGPYLDLCSQHLYIYLDSR